MNKPKEYEFYEYDRYVPMNEHYLYFINDDDRPLFGCKIYLATVSDVTHLRAVLREYYGISPYKLVESSFDKLNCKSLEDYFEAFVILKNYHPTVIRSLQNKNFSVSELSSFLKRTYIGFFLSIESFLKSYFKLDVLDTISICKNYRANDFFNWDALRDELETNGYFKFIHASQVVHILKLK